MAATAPQFPQGFDPKTPVSANAARLRSDGESLSAGLPALVAEAERLAAAVIAGVHGRRRPGAGETFWQFRPHVREDGLARVDWRRSAKSDALYVREMELESAQTVRTWRDDAAGMAYASKDKLPTKARRAAVLTTALAILLTRGGERVGSLGSGLAARPGQAGVERAAMAAYSGADAAAAFADPALARGLGRFVLASDFLSDLDQWRARFEALAGAGGRAVVLVVADPAEEDFPFSGRTQFFGPQGGDPLLFGRADQAKSHYRKRYLAHFAALGDIARRAGWPLIKTRTDRPAAGALLALHAAIAKSMH